ncbi:uncharacterized protein LOC135088036 [Ostrinia nubilalis]|uniref:uncharacterized protein LOC135088036 n=1 Tax=Ostrinia nubilalis TaxID=29057 RepID=UPI00308252B7
MKPEEESVVEDEVAPAGDVIGDTAYSERFVLKILLKLANLDSLKDEFREKPFEEDLCLLWDMTAERDVVLFLLKHDVLNLFNFALPIIDSPRIIEIMVGIVGNMCCHKETTSTLLKMDSFIKNLLEYIKTDDSLILVQLLRLINSALFLAEDEDLVIWMGFFESLAYSEALYFMLKNSSNKELLITVLENFNTVCTYLNAEKTRTRFFTHFVNKDALEALTTACTEVIDNQKTLCERDELERVSVVSMQVTLVLIGFDKSLELYNENKECLATMINHILLYYEDKFLNQKEMDTDLVDIIDSTNTIVNTVQLNEICEPSTFFIPSYCMWTAICTLKDHQNGGGDFEEDHADRDEFLKKIKAPLSNLLCGYMLHCSESNLSTVLDASKEDYENILGGLEDKELLSNVSKRTASYRTRLKEHVDV